MLRTAHELSVYYYHHKGQSSKCSTFGHSQITKTSYQKNSESKWFVPKGILLPLGRANSPLLLKPALLTGAAEPNFPSNRLMSKTADIPPGLGAPPGLGGSSLTGRIVGLKLLHKAEGYPGPQTLVILGRLLQSDH